MNRTRQAKMKIVAEFPPGSFLENLVARADNSLLVTVPSQKELWFVPAPSSGSPVQPVKLHTFDALPTGIIETEPDVFYLAVGKFYNSDEAFLFRLDLRGWKLGSPVEPEQVFQFPKKVRGLNGICMIAPRVMLLADSFAGLIWRVDLTGDKCPPVARIWLQHETMGYYPGELKPEQPGVNGVRFASRTNYLYYTATAKKLFMRVPVDPETQDPLSQPEHVSAGRIADDFCIDEDAGVAYLTTHRENTIDRVSLDPAKNAERVIVAGDPFTDELIGPSSAVWSRTPGECGHIAFFITDGGTASPPPGGPRPAKVLQVEMTA